LLVKTGFPIGSEGDGEAILDPETGRQDGIGEKVVAVGHSLEGEES
jgi:hypothetical protein